MKKYVSMFWSEIIAMVNYFFQKLINKNFACEKWPIKFKMSYFSWKKIKVIKNSYFFEITIFTMKNIISEFPNSKNEDKLVYIYK